MHHAMLMCMRQGCQQVFRHAPLLVQGQSQLRARHMEGQRLARCVVQDQDERLVIIGRKEIPRRDDVGV